MQPSTIFGLLSLLLNAYFIGQVVEKSCTIIVPQKFQEAASSRSELWTQAMYLASRDFSKNGKNASCFTANTPKMHTSKDLPIINVGLPKCGSSTLHSYFLCCGRNASHWYSDSLNDYLGICMRDAAKVGLPILGTCSSDFDVLTQMDVISPFGHEEHAHVNKYRDECFFPQISLLEQIHSESPFATFIMNFRPINDWISSVSRWDNMMVRLQHCNIPGLPKGVPKDIKNHTDVFLSLANFWCTHVWHVRLFERKHSSLTLLELDLYDRNSSVTILQKEFPCSQSHRKCWGHENANKREKKTETDTSTRDKRRKNRPSL